MDSLNKEQIVSFLSKINSLYYYNKYNEIVLSIDEFKIILEEKLREKKISFLNDINDEEKEILQNIPVLWKNTKKITQFMYPMFFQNINYLKESHNQNTYYSIISLKSEIISLFSNGIQLDQETSLIIKEFSKKIFLTKILKLRNKIDNFLPKIISEKMKYYFSMSSDINFFQNDKYLESLYYNLETIKNLTIYEKEDWDDILKWGNINAYEQKKNGFYNEKIKNNNYLAYYLSLLNNITKEINSDYWKNIYKIEEIYNSFIYSSKKEKFGNKIIEYTGISEIKNYPMEEKIRFMKNRFKGLLYSLKVIYLQDYIYNINYNLDDYYINFINNYTRVMNVLREIK